MTDRIGQQLGNYHLTRLLGQGGFAEIYLGEHPLLGTKVAIKVLHTQVTPKDVAQFQEEARILASLRHPHIVRVFDFGLDGRTPYLIMDYAPNGTLRTRHAKGIPLLVTTAVDYVKQIAQALQYAHDRKVIHRDIKPENMLIGEQGEILLSDFGIALIAQSSRYQSTQDMVGTIAYMAPEQISAHPRPASDLYSLGVVAYEWLCGTRPFHGSFTEIAIKHSIIPPPPLRGHLPTLSPDIEHVVLTALAKQPEERFASVSAFATALEEASQDLLPTERSHPHRLSSPSSPLLPPNQLAESSVSYKAQLHQSVSVPVPISEVPPDLPNPSAPEKTTSKPTVSRRAILIGVAGGAAIAAAGTGVFVITHQPSLQNQRFIYTGHSDKVNAVTWSPDGKRIASCSFDTTVQAWNANDGSNVITYRGHADSVFTVAWSPDGKRIASASGDRTVQVWNANYGSNVFTYRGHSDHVYGVAWSPDGKRIVSDSGNYDGTVQVWNATDGSNIFTYTGHSNGWWSVAWSPDGKRIASSSHDKTVQVWNATDGSNVFTYTGHSGPVYAVAWSPDGQRIASASGDRTVQVWNASDGSNIVTYRGHFVGAAHAVAWSPDGQRIVSTSDEKPVQVWNANDGSNVFTYRGHTRSAFAVAWSPDGQRIASCSEDGTVQVWYPG